MFVFVFFVFLWYGAAEAQWYSWYYTSAVVLFNYVQCISSVTVIQTPPALHAYFYVTDSHYSPVPFCMCDYINHV